MRFRFGAQAQQHLQWQTAAAGFDDFHCRRQLFLHFAADLGQVIRSNQISLVQDHQVSTGQLVGKQLV
ncbi:hypothetical protein D3C86_2203840 [compost metagenome]